MAVQVTRVPRSPRARRHTWDGRGNFRLSSPPIIKVNTQPRRVKKEKIKIKMIKEYKESSPRKMRSQRVTACATDTHSKTHQQKNGETMKNDMRKIIIKKNRTVNVDK